LPSGKGRRIDIKTWLFGRNVQRGKKYKKKNGDLVDSEGNVQDLKKFADTLVSTVITLQEHSRWSELEPGSLLFTVVLEKIPKSMLSKFYRWAKDTCRTESIETLLDWITEESEFQVKAAETIQGLHGAKGNPREEDRNRSNQNFIS